MQVGRCSDYALCLRTQRGSADQDRGDCRHTRNLAVTSYENHQYIDTGRLLNGPSRFNGDGRAITYGENNLGNVARATQARFRARRVPR